MKKENRLDEIIRMTEERMKEVITYDTKEFKKLASIHTTLVEVRNRKKFYGINVTDLFKGTLGFAAILLILNYEKSDIITTKGFEIARRFIGA